MRDEEVHTIPPELRILLDPGSLPAPENPPFRGGGGRNGGLPFPFPDISRRGRKEGGEDRIPHPKDSVIPSIQLFPGPREPEEVQGSMGVALSVRCDNEKMTVAIEKDSFQVSAVSSRRGQPPSPSCPSLCLLFPSSFLTFEFWMLDAVFSVGWTHFLLASILTWFLLFSVRGGVGAVEF